MESNPFGGVRHNASISFQSPADRVEQATKGEQARVLTTRPAPRSNVIAGEVHEGDVAAGLKKVAEILARTLGPHGAHTLIYDMEGRHKATKDGYSVLRRLTFVQEIPQMVLDHVRSVSRKIVQRVGDGSTTSVLVTHHLYEQLARVSASGRYSPGALAAAINAVAHHTAARALAASRPVAVGDAVDQELLARVATISANNDAEAGRLVASVFKDAKIRVTVEEGDARCEATRVLARNGYRIGHGYSHEAFANEGNAATAMSKARLEKASVLMFADRVTSSDYVSVIVPMLNSLLRSGKSVVVVAAGYEESVISLMSKAAREQSAPILCIEHPVTSSTSRNRFSDLATALGARIVNTDTTPRAADGSRPTQDETEALLSILGKADAVSSTASETTFIIRLMPPDVAKVRAELREEIERMSEADSTEAMSDTVSELRARERALSGVEHVIQAGGLSQQERSATKDLLDDAALACVAAIDGGVGEGMGLPVLRVLNDLHELSKVIDLSYRQVIERTPLTEEQAQVLCAHVAGAIEESYHAVFLRVLENGGVENPEGVLLTCLRDHLGYDAARGQHFPKEELRVACAAITDREILMGAASVVSLLVSSNQTVLARPSQIEAD